MKLIQQGQGKVRRWIADCVFKEKHIPYEAGFKWNPDERTWATKSIDVACKLWEYTEDIFVQNELKALYEAKQASIEESKAQDISEDFEIILPAHAELYPYQKAGVQFIVKHPNTLLADDMGLGKTCQSIVAINTLKPKRVLIVCPATLKINWYKEFRKFSTQEDYLFQIVTGKKSIIDKSCHVIIINYDILQNYAEILQQMKFDMVIADEAHYVKNAKAKRSSAFFKIKAPRKIAITGTPIKNRPIDIFYIAKWLDRKNFGNKMEFGMRYCDAKQGDFGYDFNGASNLDELQEKLRSTIMIRRMKVDVLKELPAKTRQIVEISGLSDRDKQLQFELIEQFKQVEYDMQLNGLTLNNQVVFSKLAEERKKLAIKKIPNAIEHIKDLLDNVGKLVVFAHHREVVNALVENLSEFGVVCINGETDMKDRDKAIVKFQNDENTKIFVGGIGACATGITLTASSTVHRIGQEDAVLIQHLVFDGSLDTFMLKTLLEKQKNITQALDTTQFSV